MVRKKKKFIAGITACIFTAVMSFNVSAANLTSDLSYSFSNQTQTEYYNSGTMSNYNITDDMPDYLREIYDFTPQTVYNSDFGANIILPGNDFDIYPSGNKPYYAPETPYNSTATTAQSNGNSTGTAVSQTSAQSRSSGSAVNYPDVSSNITPSQNFSYGDEAVNQYKTTPVEQVRQPDGSIGTISISKIRLNIKVYSGDITTAMLKGAAHIASSSAWDGNIAISGHNRGVALNFGRLKELAVGDIIQYTTTLGTRQYRIVMVEKISSTDWSKLQKTSDNRISLVTCLENVPSQRILVQGVEIS